MANIGTDILSLPQALILNGTEQIPLVQGGTTKRANASQVGSAIVTTAFPASLEYVIFGGGTTIGTGTFPPGLTVPFNCNIVQATLIANQTGSIVVDVWRSTFAASPPVVGGSITGASPPTITNATKSQDNTLAGWTTMLNLGDVIWYNVNSVTAIQSVNISLKVNRI